MKSKFFTTEKLILLFCFAQMILTCYMFFVIDSLNKEINDNIYVKTYNTTHRTEEKLSSQITDQFTDLKKQIGFIGYKCSNIEMSCEKETTYYGQIEYNCKSK